MARCSATRTAPSLIFKRSAVSRTERPSTDKERTKSRWRSPSPPSKRSRSPRSVADPARHRTGDIWHVWLRGIPEGQLYGYRVEGPYQPEQGHRFNPHKLLLDPFARAIAGITDWDFAAARGYDSSSPLMT